MQSRMSTRGSLRLHKSFSSSFEDNELYVLSYGVPAKPGIAKDVIEADDISRKAVADFIELNISCTSTTAESRAKIWRQ